MSFDHERLDVYQRALEFLDQCDTILEQLPSGRAHLKDQLDRAATSVVLNVAEGAGEFSPDEKRRFYRIARRSATERARARARARLASARLARGQDADGVS